MILLSSLVSALSMWLVLWLLAGKESPVSLRPVLLLSLAATALSVFVIKLISVWGLALVLAGLTGSISHWCLLSVPKAILVSMTWLVALLLFGLFVSPIF